MGRKFLVINWEGGQNFSISHHDECISFLVKEGGGCPQTSNSPTISEYFLYS